jgi:Tfp pilus assembly protein PilF
MNTTSRTRFTGRSLHLAHMLLPLAALCVLAAPAARAAPYLPASGATVVETLPRRADPQQQELRRLRLQLSAAPEDIQLVTALARRYIAVGRGEADPRYFGYAQAALAPWWQQHAPPAGVRLLRATLLQNSHSFSAAMSDLDAVVGADPGNAQAWLTRATVQTVLGRYSAATASCARLSTLANQLVSITCLANVAGVTGRLLKSDMLLDTTLRRSAGAPPEQQAWALTLLAEMAERRGDSGLAEARYLAALKIAPRDSYLLGAYADFLLERQRGGDAADLLRGQRRIDPLLLRYALALQQSRAPAAQLAEASAELQARFEAAAQRGDNVHQREQARYELQLRGDAGAALALAQQNWAVQKEVADVRILLQAALKARNRAAAAPVLQWVAQSGLEDTRIAALAEQLRGQP